MAAAAASPLLRTVNLTEKVPPGATVTDLGVTFVNRRSGAALDTTLTATRCVAVSPPGSRAVIVIVAVPVERAVIVTVDPETDTLATLVLDDVAV